MKCPACGKPGAQYIETLDGGLIWDHTGTNGCGATSKESF